MSGPGGIDGAGRGNKPPDVPKAPGAAPGGEDTPDPRPTESTSSPAGGDTVDLSPEAVEAQTLIDKLARGEIGIDDIVDAMQKNDGLIPFIPAFPLLDTRKKLRERLGLPKEEED